MSNLTIESNNHPTCILDRAILNENTVGEMDDLGLSVFAKLCGANRGAFVLDPPDGKTYGCLAFPKSFSKAAGLHGSSTIPDSATLTQAFAANNITALETVDIVDHYVSAVYASSGSAVDDNPYGCDVNGLATLSHCPHSTVEGSTEGVKRSLRPDGHILQSVTLAGAFAPALWATNGKVLTMDQVKEFYTSNDFREMANLGVNTVQIPMPRDFAFSDDKMEMTKALSRMLDKITKAGLNAILVLVEVEEAEEKGAITAEMINRHITSAAIFASNHSPTVLALQLPSSLPSLLSAARSSSTKLPLLVPTTKDQINSLSLPPDDHVYAAIDMGSTTFVAGTASSDSEGDRLKMFYHESITCINRSPIEWLDCYRGTPVYVTSGFDLAVDDCIHEEEVGFQDYGQCERFDETIGSEWWERHRQSLAARQLFTYSRGLGWSFSAWKLFDDGEEDGDGGSNVGDIDSAAKLLCLRDVAAAGLMPSLVPSLLTSNTTNDVDNNDVSTSTSLAMACLNGPKADFAMGDDTFAPTSAPPPDCGNGWWNVTAKQCDYWISPAPTPMPTDKANMPFLAMVAVGGAIVALVLQWGVKKVMGRDDGYQSLP